MRRLPEKRQTLLMSATLSAQVLRLAQRYMTDPEHISVTPDVVTVDRIEQRFITVDEDRKFDLLVKVLEREKPTQCIIFVERKRGADRLHRYLQEVHQNAAVTHGDLHQTKREKIMDGFRKGKITMLIATDVMSRGIDVQGISLIINYDLPNEIDSYVHRIGRTGRMGADGKAISFVTPEQGKNLTLIEGTINRLIAEEKVEGFDAFVPRVKEVVENKPAVPIFGRPRKKYSNRL
jgi:ATP-dependent RNA helicase DeaD